MKGFTDIFIRRPVLATVVSLLILVTGIAGIFKLNLREYPDMTFAKITVSTAYPGASPSVIQGFVTTPLERSIGSADGIDYMTASSTQGISAITVFMKLNYDPNAALAQITEKVNAILGTLPSGTKSPTIDLSTGNDMPDLVLGFTSQVLTPEEISSYIEEVVNPKLLSVGGLQKITVWGEKAYAMRIWLDPMKMAAVGVSPEEVTQALQANNIQASAGSLKGEYRFINIRTTTDLHDSEAFNRLVIKNSGGRLIRVSDIGKAELGAESYDYQVIFNGKSAIFTALNTAAGSNPLTVVDGVLKVLPDLRRSMPKGLELQVVYNATDYIKQAIKEVIKTIIEATLVVMAVIFLFLGAFRTVLIPVVTIPLSLIGVCFGLLVMGFSLNLLTLLGMVLAIGLVVDDAIVVLENIYRHVEEGKPSLESAILGAREITGPVIVMSLTLAAVFVPIGFMGGFTGALFTEFAFTLAVSVVISGVIALTFSPMLCSKVLDSSLREKKLVQRIDRIFECIKNFYAKRLKSVLNVYPIAVMVAVVVLMSCYFLFESAKTELAPTEDMSVIGVVGMGNSNATLNQLEKSRPQLANVFTSFKETKDYFIVEGFLSSNQVFSGLILKPWEDRKKTEKEIVPEVSLKVGQIPGLEVFAFPWPSLPGMQSGPGITLDITSTQVHEKMAPVVDEVVTALKKSGLFIYVSSDLKFDMPELQIAIDRNKAADLGIQMSDIATALASVYGGGNVNYFSKEGYSFEVIPQVFQPFRYNPDQVKNLYVTTASGGLVPLSSLITLSVIGTPPALEQFQQLNSAKIDIAMMPFVSQGEGIQYVQQLLAKILPGSMGYGFEGEARSYLDQGNAMIYAFIFALIIIFLLLSAQFESFRDPLIILISVPLSICGALIPLSLGLATLNIYSEIGLITLIGLITKHGILMVEFANKLQQQEGLSIRDAIEKSAAIRLRPILMTTLTMVVGVIPLLLATGAGAMSRFNVGLVISVGMLIGTLFTLFIVPTMYLIFAKDHHQIDRPTLKGKS
jgi:multidrug efflux pump